MFASDGFEVFGMVVRVVIVCMGFWAMWSLWVARDERSQLWTKKMHDIWFTHFLLIAVTLSGNIELLYRHVMPTFSIVGLGVAYAYTVQGTFRGTQYTVDEPNR